MPLSGFEQTNGRITGVGLAFEIFDMIAKKLKFNYNIILPEEDVIGNKSRGVLSLIYEKAHLKQF